MNRPKITTNIPFETWDLDLLIDYVLKFHHRNTRKYGAKIVESLNALKADNKELNEVASLFAASVEDLDLHCRKEENVLYPYISDLYDSALHGQHMEPFHCGTIQYPINAMMADHSEEVDRHELIAKITNNYTAPHGSSKEYADTLKELERFRDYLLEHIYVENEIIFPRALDLEQEKVDIMNTVSY